MKLKAVNNSKLILALITMFASSTRAFLRHYPSTVKHLAPHRATRLFSSVDIADSDAVLELFNKSKNTVILDVRSDEEILNSGFIQTTANNPWLQVSCTPMDCPLLNVAAENMIPDKSTPIVIHCASGMRAGKAKEILEAQGYTNVLNAGGYGNLGYLQEAASKN